jgi:hypothetical protein
MWLALIVTFTWLSSFTDAPIVACMLVLEIIDKINWYFYTV